MTRLASEHSRTARAACVRAAREDCTDTAGMNCEMLFPNVRPAIPKIDGSICAVAVDAEEDFDWTAPVLGTPYTTTCMRNTRDLQAILRAHRIRPTYLLTYPVLADPEVVQIIRRQIERDECDVGVQLHPWVTPPFEGNAGATASYSGNLSPELETHKLVMLTHKFIEVFGRAPRIYRAGRYGLSGQTAEKLEELGFEIDTSLAPRTDFSGEGGPDYSDYDCQPFWFGRHADLLELPLCRSIVGWGGKLAPRIYRALTAPFLVPPKFSALLTRSRCAERITLSPEGNDLQAMIRLTRGLLRHGQRILVLSFHSSSLAVGRSPYVRSTKDLHYFYDRLSAILDAMTHQTGLQFTRLADIPGLLQRPRQ